MKQRGKERDEKRQEEEERGEVRENLIDRSKDPTCDTLSQKIKQHIIFNMCLGKSMEEKRIWKREEEKKNK